MASLSVVVLGILELGSPFLLMNMGMPFHESLLIIIPALLGQCFPHPFSLSRRILTVLLAVSGILMILQTGINIPAIKTLILFLSVFSCSASICTSFLSEESSLQTKERSIMKIIGYGMSVALVLSPSFIFLLAYVLSAAGLYKYKGTFCGKGFYSKTTKDFLSNNAGFIAEGIFSYSIMSVICYRATAMLSGYFAVNDILGLLSMSLPNNLLLLYCSEIFAAAAFTLYKTASKFGVIPFSENESGNRGFLITVLLALSVFVQMRSLSAVGSALVFILSGFLFREYILDDESHETVAVKGEREYARLAGIIIAGNLLLFTAGNFSMVLAVAVVSVILSVFLKKAS